MVGEEINQEMLDDAGDRGEVGEAREGRLDRGVLRKDDAHAEAGHAEVFRHPPDDVPSFRGDVVDVEHRHKGGGRLRTPKGRQGVDLVADEVHLSCFAELGDLSQPFRRIDFAAGIVGTRQQQRLPRVSFQIVEVAGHDLNSGQRVEVVPERGVIRRRHEDPIAFVEDRREEVGQARRDTRQQEARHLPRRDVGLKETLDDLAALRLPVHRTVVRHPRRQRLRQRRLEPRLQQGPRQLVLRHGQQEEALVVVVRFPRIWLRKRLEDLIEVRQHRPRDAIDPPRLPTT
mmetsp:Transcript_9735/g.31711  ORF Transcript_9735/g.31711 Transcript_9735/m.31711 type:complete len:287 (-) Transcript_9735:209-1069(-)